MWLWRPPPSPPPCFFTPLAPPTSPHPCPSLLLPTPSSSLYPLTHLHHPPPPPPLPPTLASPKPSSSLHTFRRGFPIRALLALSAAAAFFFLRRKRALQKAKASAVMAASIDRVPSPKVIDSHLHVWAPAEQAKQYPYYPGQEPTIPGSVEDLLQAMEDNKVDGAVIVQPISHMFDHSYLSSALHRYPRKFVGCCLADPTEGGGGVTELERLVVQEGYRAVRFNPYLWPSGQKMTNDVGKAMFAKAGQLGVPVGFMCLKGLPLHIEEIEFLCSEFWETTVLIDHFGFCKPPLNGSEFEIWKRLLNLSKFPKVYVKVSAFFRVSREKFPYKDTWPLVTDLLKSFGARRLLWGSDFPYVINECGYENARNVFSALSKEGLSISNDSLEWILSGTAMELFQGAWIDL